MAAAMKLYYVYGQHILAQPSDHSRDYRTPSFLPPPPSDMSLPLIVMTLAIFPLLSVASSSDKLQSQQRPTIFQEEHAESVRRLPSGRIHMRLTDDGGDSKNATTLQQNAAGASVETEEVSLD